MFAEATHRVVAAQAATAVAAATALVAPAVSAAFGAYLQEISAASLSIAVASVVPSFCVEHHPGENHSLESLEVWPGSLAPAHCFSRYRWPGCC